MQSGFVLYGQSRMFYCQNRKGRDIVMNDVQKLIQLFGHYKGCQYFLESVQLVLQDETVLTAITKEVYIPVAKKYHTSYHCVERNIRTLCERAWEKGAKEIAQQLCGVSFGEVPTNRECIEIALIYWKQQL